MTPMKAEDYFSSLPPKPTMSGNVRVDGDAILLYILRHEVYGVFSDEELKMAHLASQYQIVQRGVSPECLTMLVKVQDKLTLFTTQVEVKEESTVTPAKSEGPNPSFKSKLEPAPLFKGPSPAMALDIKF